MVRGSSATGRIRRGERVCNGGLAIAYFLVKMDFMPDEGSVIPLADVLRAANELVSVGLIKDYALGGALAAIYYTEPVTTYDADIIFIASDKTLSAFPRSTRICNPEAGVSSASICSSTTFLFNSLLHPD